MTKRALLVVHINTFFIEMFNAGLILKDSPDYQPVFYFSMPYPTVQKDIARCQAAGLEVIDFQGRPVVPASGSPEISSTLPISGWKSRLIKRLPEKLVKWISSLNSRRHHFVYQWRRSSLVYQYHFLKNAGGI